MQRLFLNIFYSSIIMDVMYHLLISSDQHKIIWKNERRNIRLVKERGTGVVICAGQDLPSGHKINLKGHMMVNSMKNKNIYTYVKPSKEEKTHFG